MSQSSRHPTEWWTRDPDTNAALERSPRWLREAIANTLRITIGEATPVVGSDSHQRRRVAEFLAAYAADPDRAMQELE